MRYWVCLAVIVFPVLAGCNRNSQSALENDVSEIRHADHNQPAAEIDAPEILAELERLTAKAREFEATYQYPAAIECWKRIQNIVTDRFGEQSWQSKNASMALISAENKSHFSVDQINQLKSIHALQRTLARHLEEQEWAGSQNVADQILAAQRQLFGPDAFETVSVLLQRGHVYRNTKQADRAIDDFHGVANILKSAGFRDHPDLESAHSSLAALYAAEKKWAPAIANQKEATRIAGVAWGTDTANFCNQANQLGVLYHQAGNLEVAFNTLEQIKLLRAELFGENSAAYAHSCLNLGVVLLDLRRLDLAAENIQLAHDAFSASGFNDGQIIARCKSQLATIYMLKQQPELAEPLLLAVIKAIESQPTGDLRSLTNFRYRLAVALARQGKYDQAKPLLEQVIQQQKTDYGMQDQRTITSLEAYALLLERTNQTKAANLIRSQLNRVARNVDSNDFPNRY